MYKSIQISDFSYNGYATNSDVLAYKEKIRSAYLKPLETYLLDDTNKIFSADKIQEQLFPTIKDNDIFLSHAHKDEEEVIKLAIQLERLGLNVFVDSCVWGNAYDLLFSIDNSYCKIGENLFSYEKISRTSANIYMILNTALHKMIDQSELFIFLGSKTSVTVKNAIDGSKEESVRSPWIYSELMFANQVRRIQRRDIITNESYTKKAENVITMDSAPQFDYLKPNLDYSLDNKNFLDWLNYKASKENFFLNFYSLLNQYAKRNGELYQQKIIF